MKQSQASLASFEEFAKPFVADMLVRIQTHVARVDRVRDGLTNVFHTARRLRKKLIDSGIECPDEEDPLDAIERSANEELERRKEERAAQRAREREERSAKEAAESGQQPPTIAIASLLDASVGGAPP